MAEKSIDRVRIYATKKNVRAVCEGIASGLSIPEACEPIGIPATTWHNWRKRKPEVTSARTGSTWTTSPSMQTSSANSRRGRPSSPIQRPHNAL